MLLGLSFMMKRLLFICERNVVAGQMVRAVSMLVVVMSVLVEAGLALVYTICSCYVKFPQNTLYSLTMAMKMKLGIP